MHDHRVMAHVITRLLVEGSGMHILQQRFRRNQTMEYVPGWSIPITWYSGMSTSLFFKF